jgi:hypothetical protein
VEKEHQLVTKNHHRNIRLAIGIGAFGVPIGVVHGVVLNHRGFIALGMPIGLGIVKKQKYIFYSKHLKKRWNGWSHF